MNSRDKEYNDRMTRNLANRNVKEYGFATGDYVLVKQTERTKLVFYHVRASVLCSNTCRQIKYNGKKSDSQDVYLDASQCKSTDTLTDDNE